MLDLIEDGRAVSIERETFPRSSATGLFALAQAGYWSDVGTPESYIAAHHDLLAGRIRSQLPGLMPGCALDRRRRDGLDRGRARGAVPRRRRERSSRRARCIGRRQLGCARRARSRSAHSLLGAVVQERARVAAGAVVEAAVVGPRAVIGAGAHIESGCRRRARGRDRAGGARRGR